ncbi:MAG: acyl-CoA dehydrogenase family protein [Candidatus Binatia bacterium]
MDLSYGAQYEAFRAEVRAFIAEHWIASGAQTAPAPGARVALMGAVIRSDEVARRFRVRAIERGYLYRFVPKRYGGSEQPPDPIKSIIVGEEFQKAGAPGEIVGQGPSMLVPTLLLHGTEAQKQRFIRDTLLGKISWCQGYSEPQAGSDLASLRTRAVLDGDSWVVDGQKIWTSNADTADWMFCLVRTEPEAPKHQGISYLLIDMRTPGIEARPLRQMTGDADFNEVFLDKVRVPAGNIVGTRGQGWKVSRATLKHERQLIGASWMSRRLLDGMVLVAQGLNRRGRPAIEDPVTRQRLVELEAKVLASEYHGYRLLTLDTRGQDPGLAGLVGKLYGTVLGYELGKLAMDICADGSLLAPGDAKAPARGMFVTAYMWSLGNLIAGGAANIQRDIIAERGLGLPRAVGSKR